VRIPLNIIQSYAMNVVLYQGGGKVSLEVAVEGELDPRPKALVTYRVDIDPDERDFGRSRSGRPDRPFDALEAAVP
jgi:hypothetical protein